MVAVRTLYVSDAGTRRGPSIDNGTRACEGTSASATVSWMLRAGRELLQIRPSGGGLTEGFKAVSPKSYFWARNAPYPFSYLDNPFKSQQNGAPSERTKGKKPLKPCAFVQLMVALCGCWTSRCVIGSSMRNARVIRV